MGGGSARVGFWALVLHVLFAWFYAVSCFGSCGVRYRSIMHALIDVCVSERGASLIPALCWACSENHWVYMFSGYASMSDLVSMARTSSLVVMFSLSAVAVSARFIAAGIFTERVSLPSLLKVWGAP